MRTHDISIENARRLKQSLTGPEVGLWVRLRRRQLGGFASGDSIPSGPTSSIFYCPEARLAVEVDGAARIPSSWTKTPSAVLPMILEELRGRAPSVTS